MDVKWLEDLQALILTGSFTKAAERRNVTQPAFSRRIQSLEHWFGVSLVDRDQRPFALHQHVLDNKDAVIQCIDLLYELRSRVQAASKGRKRIVFASQHALTVSVFPELIGFVREGLGIMSYRLRIGNKPDCVTRFLSGEADFLLCYEMHDIGTALPAETTTTVELGHEALMPVAHPALADTLDFTGVTGGPIPLVAHPRDSFMGQVLEQECLRDLVMRCNVEVVCESAYSAGLKQLVLAGLGMAWLPRSLVAEDIHGGQLRALDDVLKAPRLRIVLHGQRKPHSQEAQAIFRYFADMQESPLAKYGVVRRDRASA